MCQRIGVGRLVEYINPFPAHSNGNSKSSTACNWKGWFIISMFPLKFSFPFSVSLCFRIFFVKSFHHSMIIIVIIAKWMRWKVERSQIIVIIIVCNVILVPLSLFRLMLDSRDVLVSGSSYQITIDKHFCNFSEL